MSTSLPQPPTNGPSIILEAISALGMGDLYPAIFKSVSAPDIVIGIPSPCYNVGLSAIQQQKLTAAAVFSGWRYPLYTQESSQWIATADLGSDETGSWQFAGFNAGTVVTATASALQSASGSTGPSSLLQVTALLTILVWAMDSPSQFYVVIDPERQLTPGKSYTESQVLQTLWTYAQHYGYKTTSA